MEIKQLYDKFSQSRNNQEKALFMMLFILQNQIQTTFDHDDSLVSLKQFLLLTMIRQSDTFHEKLTFTKLGQLLGCSRQNIKKIAVVLEKKGFIKIYKNEKDIRAAQIHTTAKMNQYFEELEQYHIQKLQTLFHVFDDEELIILMKLMHKWQDGLQSLKEKEYE